MAPMGCTPGDFNGDGRMDLLVTYWGRTPILFLARSDATAGPLSAGSYRPQDLVPQATADGKYHGPRWNTNAVAIADFAGHGHPDIFIGNYFPDSDVLDPNGQNNVVMNASMSRAGNGGGAHMLRWYAGTAGAVPTASYVEDRDAVPFNAATGWTLAAASADLTGRGLPDLYLAEDFGPDFLLHNVSNPNGIRFVPTYGHRTPTTPKSFVLGNDSFKGMGVDFGDLAGNGRFDMVVSNITEPWALEESNFVWMNQAQDTATMRDDLDQGVAPFDQRAEELGLAHTGWSWDVKMADFRNSGDLDVVQTDGFVKGSTDRWNWLQELAMANDSLLANPAAWPNVGSGDDLSGADAVAFYARNAASHYVNISGRLGIAVPTPTRGVAVGDTTGDGKLDFAVARQWGPPAFYVNRSPGTGHYLELRLYRPAIDDQANSGMTATGAPAYGATATVTTADGHTQICQLDGGSGGGGKRGYEVHIGLGANNAPVDVRLWWRDRDGQSHQRTQKMTPGTHTLVLTDTAQEVPTR
jgi:hypothetical protein